MAKRDKDLAKRYKGKPCIICGCLGEGDHILPFARCKSKDIEPNIWTLCRSHHIEKGVIGLSRFACRYSLEKELLERGFWWCELTNKWRFKFN